jgi:uncharacterized membrane protein
MNREDVTLLCILIAAIAFFILLRAFFLWYWGVNRITENQKKTNFLLRKLLENNGASLSEEEKRWLSEG